MAKKSGTNLVKNPYKKAMKSSVENAGTISGTVMNGLNLKKTTDVRIQAAYDYYLPFDTVLQATVLALRQAVIDKLTATGVIHLTEEGFAKRLHKIFHKIEDVYDIGTPEYNHLLMGGAESFESVSRNAQETRLQNLYDAIGTDASLVAAKALLLSLKNDVSTGIHGQQDKILDVAIDSASVKTVVTNATTGLWVVYFMLMIVFIADVAKAIAFFPMEFIYKAARQTIKTLMVPKASIRKILSHLFKVGETVTIRNNTAVGLWVGLALTAKDTVALWYFIPGNTTVTDIAYSLLGNPAYKFVMVKNTDLMNSGDLTFTINGI